MRLPLGARASVFALVAVAWLIVFATPEYGVFWVAPGAIVMGTAWRTWGRWGRRTRTFWRAAAILMLFALPVDLLVTASLTHPAIHLALFTQALMLFEPPDPRRHRLLVLLSLFDVLAATVLTQSLVFAFLFLLYAGLAIVALTLLHLLETAHAAAETTGGDPVDVLDRRAVRPLGLALVTAAGAIVPLIVVLFLTLPRWEYSLIARAPSTNDAVRRLQQLEQARKQTGFSNRVELGDYGRVQEDPTVVMRVKFPNGVPESVKGDTLYWRAGALDVYDGYGWSTSRDWFAYYRGTPPGGDPDRVWAVSEGRGTLAPTFGSTFLLSPYFEKTEVASLADIRDRTDLVEQEIFLELPYADNLVGLATVVAIDGPFPRGLVTDLNAGFRVMNRQLLAEKLSYRVFSLPPLPDATDLGEVEMGEYRPVMEHEFFGPFFRQHYLQLPRNLTPDVRATAAELMDAQPTVDAKIAAVLDYFNQFTYSLDTQRTTLASRPLDEFLYTTREGYCEHFATAAVILFRSAGMPARLANGFKGGVWNDLGEFYAVRQADAHTWAEVWVPRHGWIPVDPIPGGAGGVGVDPWFVPQQNSYVVYAQAFWQERVLGYNLTDQSRAATLAWEWLRQRPGKVWGWVLGLLGTLGAALAWLLSTLVAWAMVLAPVSVALLLFVMYVWRNGLPGGTLPLPGRAGPLVPFYREMLRALRRAGLEKRPTDPPRAYAAHVHDARPDLGKDVAELTHLYERVRFAERPLTGEERAAVRRRLRHLRRAARREPAGVGED